MSFRQALLDALRQPPGSAVAAAGQEAQRAVGLSFHLDSSMLPYRDGFHRMMTTLRDIEPGNRMLRNFAHSIPTHSLLVYHVHHARDAGVILGHDGTVCWYYHLGALAAHAALLQTTDDDLTHEQRDAIAAYDLLSKSWGFLESGRAHANIQPGDRLDLDHARRTFRNELMNQGRGANAQAHGQASGGMRV